MMAALAKNKAADESLPTHRDRERATHCNRAMIFVRGGKRCQLCAPVGRNLMRGRILAGLRSLLRTHVIANGYHVVMLAVLVPAQCAVALGSRQSQE